MSTIEAFNVINITKNLVHEQIESDDLTEDSDLDEEFDFDENNQINYFLNFFFNQIQINHSILRQDSFKLPTFSTSDFISVIEFPPEF